MFADLCLVGRILASGLQPSRPPGRSHEDLSPAPVPSDVCDRWSAPDLASRRLQENVLAGSSRFPRLLYRARSRHFRSRDELLSDGSAMYQLASLQPDSLHYRAAEFALGGHAGGALQVVEFSGRPNDGLVYWSPARLPIEEVGVWIAVTYATVIVFEVFKLWQASGKKGEARVPGQEVRVFP